MVVSSSLPLLGAIVQPSPYGVKRGRGRPRKNSYPVASPLLGVVSVSSDSVVGAKRGRGRPPKVVAAGKRKRGRPPKEKMQPESVQSADGPLTKRGPGRPRKEKTLESGHLKAAQMDEGRHEALPLLAEAASQAEAVPNEVGARSLQPFGNSLMEKRGRGRPRRRPLETETAETGVAALVVKRGRGRPRKENPTAGRSTETGLTASMGIKRGPGRPRKENPSAGRSTETGLTASMGIKRGPGRPRKVRPSETVSVETAVEVFTDLTEGRPEKGEDLASRKETETQGVLLVEEMDAQPANAGGVLVSGEEAEIAPMDAGGAVPRVVSGEEAAIAPMDAGDAMPGVDPMDSDVGTKSH